MAEWKTFDENSCYLRDEDDDVIACCNSHEICAQIVLEHNSHDALVDAIGSMSQCSHCGRVDCGGCSVEMEHKAALALAEVKP